MLLKWVGSKRRQLPVLLDALPMTMLHYVEPFLGGGSTFFAIWQRVKEAVILGDVNAPLMNFYRMVRDRTDDLIDQVSAGGYENDSTHYYMVRERFNAGKDATQYPGDRRGDDLLQLAADFYYLNRCGYRGLYRESKGGKFNTPYGHYKTPWGGAPAGKFREAATALARASLLTWPFQSTITAAPAGAFIYCDPPYTGGFVYGSAVSDGELAELLQSAKIEKGAGYAISGPDSIGLQGIYPEAETYQIDAMHMIGNGKKCGRRHCELLLIGG